MKINERLFNEYYLSLKLIESNNEGISCSCESKLLDIIVFCVFSLVVITKDKTLATYVVFDTLETILTRSYSFFDGRINPEVLLRRVGK